MVLYQTPLEIHLYEVWTLVFFYLSGYNKPYISDELSCVLERKVWTETLLGFDLSGYNNPLYKRRTSVCSGSVFGGLP